MPQPIRISPGTKIELKDFDARFVDGDWEKESALKQVEKNCDAIDKLTYRLYAENRRAILVVLQGMDTSGKDGAIRRLSQGLNPQTCQVTSFKAPTHEELDHDFLWRIHKAAPRRGNVGIFNRSHYEDVIIVRVHELVPETEWKARYDQINAFEKLLTDAGTTILKFFLHISKEEQKERLEARLADPAKRWKFNPGDVAERSRWDDYQRASEDALTKCSTEHAPWHIVPADRKWNRDLVISGILRETLEEMNPQFPPDDPELATIKID